MGIRSFPAASTKMDYGAHTLPIPSPSTGASWIVVAQSYSASITFDLTSYSSYARVTIDITLTGALALNFSNGTDGQVIVLRLRQDGTGGRTWSPGAAIRFSADIPSITLSTAASKLDRISLEWCSADSKADVTAYNKGY